MVFDKGYVRHYYILKNSPAQAIVTLRQFHNKRHKKAPAANIRIHLSAHKRHQTFADKKSKTVALYLIRIAAAVKALEYPGQLLPFKGAARI